MTGSAEPYYAGGSLDMHASEKSLKNKCSAFGAADSACRSRTNGAVLGLGLDVLRDQKYRF